MVWSCVSDYRRGTGGSCAARGGFGPFAFAACRNYLFEVLRAGYFDRCAGFPVDEDPDAFHPVDPRPGPAELAGRRDPAEWVHARMGKARPAAYRTFAALLEADFNGSAVARALGVTPGAVQGVAARTFGRLRRRLRGGLEC